MLPTLHLIGLPHTDLKENGYPWCAYTKKAVCFAKAMRAKGYTVREYGGDEYSEYSVNGTNEKRNTSRTEFYEVPNWVATEHFWTQMEKRVVEKLNEVAKEGDFLCLVTSVQDGIAQKCKVKNLINIEIGIGYHAIGNGFAAFEDHSHQSLVYKEYKVGNGFPFAARRMDVVVPNYFDGADYVRRKTKGTMDAPYVLVVARKIWSKGIHIIAHAVKKAREFIPNLRLVVAGPGSIKQLDEEIARLKVPSETVPISSYIYSNENPEGFLDEYGIITGSEKDYLYSNCLCFSLMTLYAAPFEGAHIEALWYGAPVVVANNGAYQTTAAEVNNMFGVVNERPIYLAQISVEDVVEGIKKHAEVYGLDAHSTGLDGNQRMSGNTKLEARDEFYRRIRNWCERRRSLAYAGTLYDEWFRKIMAMFPKLYEEKKVVVEEEEPKERSRKRKRICFEEGDGEDARKEVA